MMLNQQLRPGCHRGSCSLGPHLRLRQSATVPLRQRKSALPAHRAVQCPFRHPALRVVQAQAAAAFESPFQQERPQDALQNALANLPGAAFSAGAVLLVGLTAGAGLLVGGRSPAAWRTVGQAGGALIGASAGAFVVKRLQEKRAQAAINVLHNLLRSKEDPASLTREEVEDINSRFGVDLAISQPTEVATLYGLFLEASIPRGDTPLTGKEADSIRRFKEALGLSDEDAAPVHMDVGRRFIRSSFEAGSREANALEKKTFQKLIFVSNLVFGDQKAAFLLPWRRVFKLTDSQLAVAKRDSAKALFKSFLDERGGFLQADKQQLTELREYQQNVRLSDDVAKDIVKEAARARLEDALDTASEVVKRRTRVRDYSEAITALDGILRYNRELDTLAPNPDVVPGLGRTSVWGGKYDATSGEGKGRELRQLFRIYLEEKLRLKGSVDDELENDLADLQLALALGPKEAGQVREEVISAAYRRLLREEFQSGRLKAAASKAEVLADLCDRLKYDSDAATQVHKGIYTERIETFLEDQKLSDKEADELSELRKLLCLKASDVADIERATKGRIFRTAVNDALGAGIDGFSGEDRKEVKSVRQALRLNEGIAKDILKDSARKAFLGFVTRSRNVRNRLDGAKELKKLVYFSNIVVAPLLQDLQTKEEREAAEKASRAEREAVEARAKQKADKEAAMKEFADTMAKAKEQADREAAGEAGEAEAKPASEADKVAAAKEAEPGKDVVVQGDSAAEAAPAEDEDRPATLAKAQDAAAARAQGEEVGSTGVMMKSQKQVTLGEDLELRDRTDIYRNFLLYCMSGDVVALPMGTSVVVERDSSEFARLSQLGDILGLSPIDVNEVHSGLAEQSFRHQVQTIMADGQLTKERSESLTEMRTKMGLSEQAAGKIIKGVQNQRLIGNLQAAKSSGQLTLSRLLDMRESGVDIESFVSEDMRLQLYTTEVKERLTDGTGEFDNERLLKQLPADLQLPEKKVQGVMNSLAKDRRRSTLVQAVSLLRQKKLDDATKAVNNLMSADAALPAEKPAHWDEKSELQDLYSIYISRESSQGKQAAAAKALGISDSEAASLRDIVNQGGFKLEEEAAAESSFF